MCPQADTMAPAFQGIVDIPLIELGGAVALLNIQVVIVKRVSDGRQWYLGRFHKQSIGIHRLPSIIALYFLGGGCSDIAD